MRRCLTDDFGLSAGNLRCSIRRLFAGLTLALVLPLTGATQDLDPLAVVHDACTLQEISAAERIRMLAAAGWRTAADTTETREWETLIALVRFPAVFGSTDSKYVASLIDGLTRPAALWLPPGQVLTMDDVAAYRANGGGFGVTLSHPGLPGLLYFVLLGKGGDSAGLSCTLGLSEPIGDILREQMVAARQPLTKTVPESPDRPETRYGYKRPTLTDSLMILQFLDIGPASTLHDLSLRAGYSQRLRTRVTTTIGPFPLEAPP